MGNYYRCRFADKMPNGDPPEQDHYRDIEAWTHASAAELFVQRLWDAWGWESRVWNEAVVEVVMVGGDPIDTTPKRYVVEPEAEMRHHAMLKGTG